VNGQSPLASHSPAEHPVPPPPPASGLTSAQAADRLATEGRNVMAEKARRPVFLQILLRFRNPLILLLLGASAVSAATGDVRSFVVTSIMVLLRVGLDFVRHPAA